MDQQSVDKYIKEISGAEGSRSYEKHLVVYEVNEQPFAMIEDNKVPLRLSLRCESRLAALLKEKYDEVMPGHKLNQRKWITIVSSGQLKPREIKDLINHSYLLVRGQL